jgi:Zinc knuckle
VRALIKKLTTDIAHSIQVEWYVAGFPEEMAFQIRQTRPATLREAMESAQNYENSAQSLRRSIKKGKKMERGRSKKYERRERRRKKFSDSDTSSPGTGTDTPTSDSTSSDSEAEISSYRRGTRRLNERASRKPVKVKVEEDDSKKLMKTIQESLEAIKVNLADNRRPRRMVPTTRTNVWCSRCASPGHYASECNQGPQKQIHFVDEEGVYYTLPDTEDYEEVVNPVFQIQAGYGRGRIPQQLIRANVNPHTAAAGSSHGNFPPSRFPPGCCFVCGSPQHYANLCPHKGHGQGAPLVLPCQNCQEYGHVSHECPKPQQVRTLYRHVEVPPKNQTALNYGSTAGIENAEK